MPLLGAITQAWTAADATRPFAAISPGCLGPAGCGTGEPWGLLALGACLVVIAVGLAVARWPAARAAGTTDRMTQGIGIVMVVVAGAIAIDALLDLLARIGWWPWGTIVPLSTVSTCVIDFDTATCTYAAAAITPWALWALRAAVIVIALGIGAAILRPAVRTAVPQFVLLVLGVGIATAGLFSLIPFRGETIWCDFGRAPTRYVPVEDRTTGCTSFLSDEEANNGPNRNDTSWIGFDFGPEPTPLAVGVKWDNPAVPPSPDRRGVVLVVGGIGFVGLSAGMGRRRQRARDVESGGQ